VATYSETGLKDLYKFPSLLTGRVIPYLPHIGAARAFTYRRFQIKPSETPVTIEFDEFLNDNRDLHASTSVYTRRTIGTIRRFAHSSGKKMTIKKAPRR
jgi:hypothetical protein